MTKNFVDEAPAEAYVNMIILQELEQKPDVMEIVQEIMLDKFTNIPKGYRHTFRNPSLVLGLLYCLVVLPKEKWDLEKEKEIYQDLDKKKICKLFSISNENENENDDPSYHLIHHLRNSIAHARINTDESQNYCFKDKRPSVKEYNWCAKINSTNLMKFCDILNKKIFPMSTNKR